MIHVPLPLKRKTLHAVEWLVLKCMRRERVGSKDGRERVRNKDGKADAVGRAFFFFFF